MQSTTRRRLIALAYPLAALAASGLLVGWLGGCATNGDGWQAKATHQPLPARFIEVAAEELTRICGSYPGKLLHGCAHRDYLNGVCWIYTAPNPPLWLQLHESYHCAGFSHGRS